MVLDLPPAETLARLGEKDRRAVEHFRDEVRKVFGSRLNDLRLFGSKLRGDDREESDIDLLVLIADSSWEDTEKVLAISGSIDFRLRPYVKDFDGYHAPASRATGFYEELRASSARI